MRFELALSLDDDAAMTARDESIGLAFDQARNQLALGLTSGTVRDVNGNTIGAWILNPAGTEARRA